MFAVILLASLAAFQAGSPPSSRRAESIDCRLVLNIDRSLDERWEHTSGSEFVHIGQSESVFRKQFFGAALFFSHYALDASGAVHIQYDIRITEPDGSVYAESKDMKGFSRRVAGTGGVLLAEEYLRVCFDPEDALGKYAVDVVVRDQNNGSSTTAKSEIELVEYVDGPGFEDEDAFDDWFVNYFENPQPARAISALRETAKQGLWEEEDRSGPTSAFFEEIFENDPWLYPILLSKYGEESANTRLVILRLVAFSSFDSEEFARKLTGEDLKAWKDLRAKPRRDRLLDPITDPAHLDELWGMFFAGGKFDAIRRLCDALSPEETKAVPEGTWAPPGEEEGLELREVIREVALWSIGSNASDHPLVKAYCQWILADEKTPEGVRRALREALED